MLRLAVLASLVLSQALFAAPVIESARAIPVLAEVDVVVVGGTTGGVAAAAEASARGARVLLVGPRAYLGEDIAGTLRLWLDESDKPASPIAKAMFPDGRFSTPLQIKSAMDKALLDAKVSILTGSFVTDVLRDEAGRVAGVTIANRAGRQAIIAKAVIDATERATVARLAGATATPYPAGPQPFTRIVIGGALNKGQNIEGRSRPFVLPGGKQATKTEAFEYTIRIPMKEGSWASFALAEQIARDGTFHKDQLDGADSLFQVPPDSINCQASVAGEWRGAAALDLKALRPAGIERMWIVGGCADVSRPAAEKLVRPLDLLDVGQRVGAAAAEEAKAAPVPPSPRLPASGVASAGGKEEAREFLGGARPGLPAARTIRAEARELPLLGEYDVVVVGGGTGGAPAGIGASRQKVRTLVLEYLHVLGGVGTAGMIGKYYHGNRVGFTTEHDTALGELESMVRVVGKAELWRRDIRAAGGDIWMGVLGCGALVESGKVVGVIVATPFGRGVVRAKSVVDSTGNCDIAAAAGAQTDSTSADEVAVQGAGLPIRNLGVSYANNDYTFADDSDPLGATQQFLQARRRAGSAYDVGQIINTRERRRIVGDVTVSPLDLLCQRTFPDTVTVAASNFDSHGYTVHPIFLLRPPNQAGLRANVPYRALLPKGLDGVLVTGLATSAHRDAMPVIRMQPDVQNQGYAAGVAAAMAAREGKTVRTIDVKKLQAHLVEKEILPSSVLQERDSFPMSAERVAGAVKDVGAKYDRLEIVLAHERTALPLLRQAYAAADGESKLVYAHVLAMLGDATGLETLLAAVKDAPWDKGWNFRGMGQFGASISRLDSYLIALGQTRDPRALAAIIARARTLKPTDDFSHYRAAALAAEAMGSADAVPLLAALIEAPGVMGHAVPVNNVPPPAAPAATPASARKSGGDPRSLSLRELALARALYRLGDHQKLAERVLQTYVHDMRSPYAAHAIALLAEGPGRKLRK